jgi:NTE family protein
LVDPSILSLKLFELFSPSEIKADYDFNQLFVPFRCVASDIYKKEEVVFKNGRLDRAIQASISIPFYFRPIENENQKILIDGGVYNNLPIKPMKKAFHPDYIIATSVANTDKPKIISDDLGEFVTNMMLQRQDSLPEKNEGIFIDVILNDVGMMNFRKIDEAYSIGYRKGLETVDSIKSQISRRKPLAELQAERKNYRESLPEITFDDVQITGVNDEQKKFFKGWFRKTQKTNYTLSDFKKDYLNLMAGNSELEAVPTIVYNDKTGSYILSLNIKRPTSPHVAIGMNGSSMNANQLYLGLKLSRFRRVPINYRLDLFWGNMYSSTAYTSSLETGGKHPLRYQLTAAANFYHYYDPAQTFFNYSKPLFNQGEYFLKLKMATPVFCGMIAEASAGFGFLQDKYSSLNPDLATDNPTKSALYTIGKGSVRLFESTLNHKLYPTAGKHYCFSAGYFPGKESYKDRLTDKKIYSGNFHYFSVSGEFEKYFPLNKMLQLKGLVSGYYSDKPLFYDYESTVIEAASFTPTPHSLANFNPDLRANKYLALGMTPILKINSSSHIRLENYFFMPVHPIENIDGKAGYGDVFSKNTYFGELSVVMNLPIISLQAFANFYNRAESHFNFGVNIGYLIFGEKFGK